MCNLFKEQINVCHACNFQGGLIANVKLHFFGLPWQQIGCHGNGSREVFSVRNPELPAKFGAHRSVNVGGVSGQTESGTLLPL